jgi:hypothetical protein
MCGARMAVPWGGLLACLVLAGVATQPAHAVVVATTTGNTSAPADDFGFAHVAKWIGPTDTGSGVYLGYGWVLTAAHLGAAPVELNGTVYSVASGTSRTLQNPIGLGLTTDTDLTLFRLATSPRMTPLTISEVKPWAAQPVIMVGRGNDRLEDMLAWDISGTYPNGTTGWVWTETTPPGDKQGFKLTTTRTMRWGTNQIEANDDVVVTVGSRDILTLKTDFDSGTGFEAQAAAGDSGGGVFYKRGSQWELTGIINAISVSLPNQPASTVVIDSRTKTYIADLAEYRDQILNVITPTLGDANFDEKVDDADAAILAAHWQMTSGAIWEDGDFNGDGRVDDRDASIMAAHWLEGVSESVGSVGSGSAAGAVPEPATFVLLLGAAATMLVYRRFGRSVCRW